MRIVYLGTPDIAVPSLEAIVSAGHDVSLVVSQPDRARNRGQDLQPTPVHAAAERLGLTCIQPTKIKTPEFAEELSVIGADVFVIVAYGRIIPDHLLALAPNRWINMHPSLLPLYRGPAPIQGPLFAGDEMTGVTTMLLASEMDAGDVLLQWETPIAPGETAGDLHDRLARLGAECLVETLAQLDAGTITPTPQNHDQATFTQKLAKADGVIDFRKPARTIAHQVRAVTPWPGASIQMDGETWKLWRVETRASSTSEKAGTVLAIDDNGILVACGGDALLLQELQRPGKQRLATRDFLRGNPIELGARFSVTD